MQFYLYADVIFFVNFIMDFIILKITAKLHKKKVKLWWILLGSFVASSIYIVFLLLPSLFTTYNFLSSISIIMISVLITFHPRKIKEFLKLVLLTHVVAFSIGGASVGLFYYTNVGSVFGDMLSFTIRNFSLAVLLGVSCTTYILLKIASNRIKAAAIKKQQFYTICIKISDKNISLNALVDTGNTLIDPVSSAPVIIVEFSCVCEILPTAFKDAYKEKKEMELHTIYNCVINTDFSSRIRLLPFKSLGNENGMIVGFKPDSIEILDGEKSILVSNVIVGISNGKLSADSSYQGLLNPQILENDC